MQVIIQESSGKTPLQQKIQVVMLAGIKLVPKWPLHIIGLNARRYYTIHLYM